MAVIVGINQFLDPNCPPLTACVADAKLLRDTLVARCGFEDSFTKLLTDDGKGIADQPIAETITSWVTRFAEPSIPDDTLLFYFSGHGIESDGETYLVGASAQNVPIPGETVKAKGSTGLVSLRAIRAVLDAAKARTKFVILDACHSGSTKSTGGTMSKGFDASLDKNFGSKGVGGVVTDKPATASAPDAAAEPAREAFLTFASCRVSQVSHEDRTTGHGVFTLTLCDGLKGKADSNGDGAVTHSEISAYLLSGVESWCAKNGTTNQTPRVIGYAEGEIVLTEGKARAGTTPAASPTAAPSASASASPSDIKSDPDMLAMLSTMERDATALQFRGTHDEAIQAFKRARSLALTLANPNDRARRVAAIDKKIAESQEVINRPILKDLVTRLTAAVADEDWATATTLCDEIDAIDPGNGTAKAYRAMIPQ
jgi:hypothetical protein